MGSFENSYHSSSINNYFLCNSINCASNTGALLPTAQIEHSAKFSQSSSIVLCGGFTLIRASVSTLLQEAPVSFPVADFPDCCLAARRVQKEGLAGLS